MRLHMRELFHQLYMLKRDFVEGALLLKAPS